MSNISTFGTFTMARLGIYASHKAIDIVGNNISNINTEGYTRQSIDQFSLNMGGSDRYQSAMDTRVGSGAFVQGVTQMRDQFLDIRYRSELASVGAMDQRLDGLNQIASVLDEVGRGDDEGGVLEAHFNEMIQMMQRLNTEGAGRDEFDTLFRSAASTVVNTLHSYAQQLQTIRDNAADNFHEDVDAVNTILERIQNLNVSIRKTQIYGGNALEQQDERNVLIDQLAKYTRISVLAEKEYLGENKTVDKLVIKTSDAPQRTLVDGIYATRLSIRQVDDGNGGTMDDPDFELNLSKLTDPMGRTLTLGSTDGGGVAVSEGVAVTGAEVSAGSPSTYETEAEAQALADQMNASEDFTKSADGTVTYEYAVIANTDGKYEIEKRDVTNSATLGSVAVTTESTLSAGEPGQGTASVYDTAEEAKAAAEKLNASGGGETVQTDGSKTTTEYRSVKNDDGKYEVHAFQNFTGEVELQDTELYGSLQSRREILTKQGVFSTAEELQKDPNAASKRGIPFYQKSLDVLANTLATVLNTANVSTNDGGKLFSNDGTKDTDGTSGAADDPPITASNIAISKSWANGSFRVETSSNKESQSTANDNLNRILNLLTADQKFVPQGTGGNINDDAVSTEVFFTGSFQELVTNHMAGSLAQDQNTTKTMLHNYETVSDELYVDRDAVMGVDLNDEAINMMMFQKSYSAACRLMTVYDEMLDRLINGTAM